MPVKKKSKPRARRATPKPRSRRRPAREAAARAEGSASDGKASSCL